MGLFGWGSKKKEQTSQLASGLAHLTSSLENEQNKSEIIINAIADGVLLVDPSGTLLTFNQAAGLITGWDATEAVGLDHHSVFNFINDKGEPFAQIDNPIDQVLQNRTRLKEDNAMIKNRNNNTVVLSLTLTPLIAKDGSLQGAVGIFRDVTVERTEEKQRAEFISTASHEMRTPVAAIEGYLALAMNEKVSKIDPKAREFLTKAHDSTQHLGRLFQDLLTASKSEDGRLANHPIVMDVGLFIEELASDMRFSAQKKGLHMEYVIGSQPSNLLKSDPAQKVLRPFYYIQADPERIREVLTNLFDNAVKYTEKGTITLGLTGNDQVVQMFVKDTGVGIAAEHLPHLFQKFYRIDNSATRLIGGTGLGLFICRKIVEFYHGRIWAESKIGEGSTFYINLPRVTPEKAAELKKQEAGIVVTPEQATTP